MAKQKKDSSKVVDYIFGAHNYEAHYNPKRKAKTEDLGGDRMKVLVWELPVRIWHWVNFFSIIVLMITGIYIGRPFVATSVTDGANGFLMAWVRIVHFIAGFVFIAGLIVRLYWTFAGNRYTTFDIYKPGFIRGLWESVKFYLFLPNKKPHTLGHNALAQFAYWVIFGFCSLLIVFTGLFMFFEPQQGTFWSNVFLWVPKMMGGESFTPRSVHHLAAWGIMVFMVLHIYLAFREDYLVRNGTMSSIFSGWKFDKKKYLYENEGESEKSHEKTK